MDRSTRRLFADPASGTDWSHRRTISWPSVTQFTLAVVAVGLMWRVVRYALAFPLFGDEAFVAINFLIRDLGGLARPLEFDQIAPPAFLWLEWLAVHALGSGERALRLVPFLAGVSSLLLFWRFSRRSATRRATLLAVAMLAASFYPVRHATEVKPYAIDLLVSLIVTMLGYAVWRRPSSHGRWLTLIAAASAGVWCSYTAAFPAASAAVLLGLRCGRERTPKMLAFGALYLVALGLSFAAVVVTFAAPQASSGSWLPGSITWRDAFPPLDQPWRLPWWLLDVHTGEMLAYPHGGKNFGSSATFLLVVLGSWSMARHRARRPLLLLLLGPLPVAFVAAALHRYPYGTAARVTMYMAPAFCLLAAEGIIALLKRWGGLTRGPIVIAALLGLLPLSFTVHDVIFPYFRLDDLEHRRIALRLAAHTGPGDRWIAFNGATPPPMNVPNVMISQWIQRVAEIRFYLQSLSPVPLSWEPDPRAVAPSPNGRTWLIIHRHGHAALFPRERLAAYEHALTGRLGVATTFFYPLEKESSIEVWLFER
jgi:hypothetical protein